MIMLGLREEEEEEDRDVECQPGCTDLILARGG